jgi:O-acetylserine/cysteine efflux transporter
MSESQRRAGPLTPFEFTLIALIAVVWGVNNAAAKVATAEMPPLLAAALRFVIAAVVLLPFVRPPFPQPRNLMIIALLAGPGHFGLLYLGFAMAHDLSPLSVSLQMWIPLTALLSWLFLKEPLSKPAIGGLVLAFVGVAIMTLDAHALRDGPAIGIGVMASSVWALATVTARRSPHVPPLKMQGMASVSAAIALGAASAVFERDRWGEALHADTLAWAGIVFGALASTVGASALLFWMVQRREAGRITPYMLTSPLVSTFIGVGFMGDVLTPQIVIGALLGMGGVAVVALVERRLKAKSLEIAEEVGAPS